jgi:hypothetical protein
MQLATAATTGPADRAHAAAAILSIELSLQSNGALASLRADCDGARGCRMQ